MQEKINQSTLLQFLFLFILIGFLMFTSYSYGKGSLEFSRGLSIGMSVSALLMIVFLQFHKNGLFLQNRLINGWNKTINDFEAWRNSIMQYLPPEMQEQLTKKPEETKAEEKK